MNSQGVLINAMRHVSTGHALDSITWLGLTRAQRSSAVPSPITRDRTGGKFRRTDTHTRLNPHG